MFGTYLLAQLPGWLLGVIAAWLLHRMGAVTASVAAILVAVWVVKDLLMFPLVRRFYEPQSARTRIVGETGRAVTDLSPDGFVRVHGELWQARAATRIARDARVRVLDIHGLVVDVEAADSTSIR